MALEQTQKALGEVGKDMVKKIQIAIKRSKKVNTGGLYKSIRYKLYQGGLKITMVGYGKYVIGTDDNWKFYPYGRRPGKRPPPSREIEKWLVTPRGKRAFNKMRKNNRKLTIKQAAFVIARSIGRRGIKAMEWQPQVKEIIKKIDTKDIQKLEKAYVKDIEAELKKSGSFLN